MKARGKKTDRPSAARWVALDDKARADVLERLEEQAQIRERLAEEHPDDAALFLALAEPFRAAIDALSALASGDVSTDETGPRAGRGGR